MTPEEKAVIDAALETYHGPTFQTFEENSRAYGKAEQKLEDAVDQLHELRSLVDPEFAKLVEDSQTTRPLDPIEHTITRRNLSIAIQNLVKLAGPDRVPEDVRKLACMLIVGAPMQSEFELEVAKAGHDSVEDRVDEAFREGDADFGHKKELIKEMHAAANAFTGLFIRDGSIEDLDKLSEPCARLQLAIEAFEKAGGV